jgi:hypothetical protein
MNSQKADKPAFCPCSYCSCSICLCAQHRKLSHATGFAEPAIRARLELAGNIRDLALTIEHKKGRQFGTLLLGGASGVGHEFASGTNWCATGPHGGTRRSQNQLWWLA